MAPAVFHRSLSSAEARHCNAEREEGTDTAQGPGVGEGNSEASLDAASAAAFPVETVRLVSVGGTFAHSHRG